MKELKAKVVIITGGSSGIGKATAIAFAQKKTKDKHLIFAAWYSPSGRLLTTHPKENSLSQLIPIGVYQLRMIRCAEKFTVAKHII